MPFNFDQAAICPTCPLGGCLEDRRVNRVRNRDTEYRWLQARALQCTFDAFIPGTDNDPDPTRTFDQYLGQMRHNMEAAGALQFGPGFALATNAKGKVEGDAFELLEAAALWNAFATWNRYMDGGPWESTVFTAPPHAVQTPTRKVAALKLPRGYDAINLFREEVRRDVQAMVVALEREDMRLGLSSPDIVGVRLPHPLPPELAVFQEALTDFSPANQRLLEHSHRLLEGRLDGRSFLFAIAVKRTTRSDRLYQPLFEANILKFLIEHVLRGAAFRFYVHMGSLEGSDVVNHYRAASLISLVRGGRFSRAIDGTVRVTSPTQAAQAIIDDVTRFPL